MFLSFIISRDFLIGKVQFFVYPLLIKSMRQKHINLTFSKTLGKSIVLPWFKGDLCCCFRRKQNRAFETEIESIFPGDQIFTDSENWLKWKTYPTLSANVAFLGNMHNV